MKTEEMVWYLFGREWPVSGLNDTAATIRTTREEAERLGLTAEKVNVIHRPDSRA